MRADKKIVFMDGLFPSILFPVGPPEEGGSCAFLTEHCYEYCPSKSTNIHEERALQFFKDNTAEDITEKILDEVCELSMMHLYWWSWGDCLPELEDKILQVMLKLKEAGLIQNGYTRNKSFWKKVPFTDSLRMGFHVETEEELKEKEKEGRVLCLPEVDRGKAVLYYQGKAIAECCGIWCEWKTTNEVRIADCYECFLNKQGCFIE